MAYKNLPRDAKRLPKGTTRHDFDPEVYAEWRRNRRRQRADRYLLRLAHQGTKQCTFTLGHEARAALDRLSKERGLSKNKTINQLLLEYHHVQLVQEQQ